MNARRQIIQLNLKPPRARELEPAYEVLKQGLSSVNSLAALYDRATKRRGRGAPTHEEQDLLRAMLVLASSALDASLKRLLLDAYGAIVSRSQAAHNKASEHLHRHVLKRIDEHGQRLASALLTDSLRSSLLKLIVEDLTSQSLQSVEEIQRVGAYLGLDNVLSREEQNNLKDALLARNEIVHQMDVVLTGRVPRGGRKRRQRKRKQMHKYAESLLTIGARLLEEADKALHPESRLRPSTPDFTA